MGSTIGQPHVSSISKVMRLLQGRMGRYQFYRWRLLLNSSIMVTATTILYSYDVQQVRLECNDYIDVANLEYFEQ